MDKIRPLDQIDPIVADTDNSTTKVNKIFQIPGSIMEELVRFASSVPDFRRTDRGNFRHVLRDIIMLMVLGRASGCVRRAEIIEYGGFNLNKFRKMGMLRNGVPSEATLCRVENGIDDLAMADRMQKFIALFHTELCASVEGREIICIDGKSERGTAQENGRNPDIVGAFSFNTGMTLATGACQEKSNEIKAVPLLLKKIDISGKIVTADAMSLHVDTPDLESIVRAHWSIESMHWQPNRNLAQDKVKRKYYRSARNLDTIQRTVHSIFSIWRGRRKKEI